MSQRPKRRKILESVSCLKSPKCSKTAAVTINHRGGFAFFSLSDQSREVFVTEFVPEILLLINALKQKMQVGSGCLGLGFRNTVAAEGGLFRRCADFPRDFFSVAGSQLRCAKHRYNSLICVGLLQSAPPKGEYGRTPQQNCRRRQ